MLNRFREYKGPTPEGIAPLLGSADSAVLLVDFLYTCGGIAYMLASFDTATWGKPL